MLSTIGLGNDWQNIKFYDLTKEGAAAPYLNNGAVTARRGEPIPAAGMSVEEALYGKPEKESHTLRNIALTILGLGAAVGAAYGAAKTWGVKISTEATGITKFTKQASDFTVKWTENLVINPAKSGYKTVNGWFKSSGQSSEAAS